MFGTVALDAQIRGDQFDLLNRPIHQYDLKPKAPILDATQYRVYIGEHGGHYENDQVAIWLEGVAINIRGQSPSNYSEIAESIYHIYQDAYVDLGRHVTGHFCILIMDKERKEIHAWRDPMGVMPFYYAIDGQHCYFSSELRRFSAIDSMTEINWDYLHQYLDQSTQLPLDQTWFSPVQRLTPGHRLAVAQGDAVQSQYYYFNTKTTPRDRASAISQLQDKMQDAVIGQLGTGGDIHAQYSAGLDSTGICAIAHHWLKENRKLHLYMLGLTLTQRQNPYEIQDDVALGDEICDVIVMPRPTVITENDQLDPAELTRGDFPHVEDWKLVLESTCRTVAKRKGNILLSGHGGDQCITYNQPPFFLRDAFFRFDWRSLQEDGAAYGWKYTARMIASVFPWAVRPIHRPPLNRKKKAKDQWLKKHSQPTPRRQPITSITQDMIYLLTLSATVNRIEAEKEIASYYGIEMRYPYLDMGLVQYFLSLPSHLKIMDQKGRTLYRKAIQKWVNYTPFLVQRKSRTPTLPIEQLRNKQSKERMEINGLEVYQNLPSKLQSILIKKYFIVDNLDQKLHRKLIRIASFIRKYDQIQKHEE